MRNQSFNILNKADNVDQTGSAIDCSQIVSASFHAYATSADAVGVIQIQASNDSPPLSYQQPPFEPSNWVDIPSATASIDMGVPTVGLVTIASLPYRWIRAVYTSTSGGGAGTKIVVNMCGLGV